MRQTVGILGTPIDILNTEAALARMEQFIQERRFHQVATANADFLINALADPELRHILRNADLVVPDGMPVVWAARATRSRLPERVTGADIVPELARMAAQKGYRIFMLGAMPEVAQAARERMEAGNPGLQIVGCISPQIPSISEMDSEAILLEIERTQPDILLVAFGNPKQEKWIYLHRERLRNVPVCIGVGGTFDFLAGQTSRAPGWMQRHGLEWIFRLFQEPRRLWKRYVRDFYHFNYNILKQWYGMHRVTSKKTGKLLIAEAENYTLISIVGGFTSQIILRFQAAAEEAINAQRNLILDFSKVTTLDGEALGTLLNLPKRAAFRGSDLCLLGVPRKIAKVLRRSQLQDGLYKMVDSVAQAFTNGHTANLFWHIQAGANAAVVTVSGAAENDSTARLEAACAKLLRGGKRLDLDLRGVYYADSALLAALHRLRRVSEEASGSATLPAAFRLIVSEALLDALRRDRSLPRFTLLKAPELPPDAMTYDLSEDADETANAIENEIATEPEPKRASETAVVSEPVKA